MSTKHIELNNQVIMRDANGFFRLDKDLEAAELFYAEALEKTVKFDSHLDRIDYLIANDYYIDVLQMYSRSEVEKLLEEADKHPYKAKSYMAVSKFYSDYALKTDDGKQYLEDFKQRAAIVGMDLGHGDYRQARDTMLLVLDGVLQPATPTYLNAGRTRSGEQVSCFLIDVDDSIDGIAKSVGDAMQLAKIGGGVALNVSKIRARSESIQGIEGAAKGIIPVLKQYDDVFSYVDQMRQRKGSGAAYYNIFGYDVVEFLDSKKINADEKSRLKTLSIGLTVPNYFYELAEKNEDLWVFGPGSVKRAYGVELEDMDMWEMYNKLLNNPKVQKQKAMRAREMLTRIALTQLESGYPYIINIDVANAANPLRKIGRIKMSNLCTEIYQIQLPSSFDAAGALKETGWDISCNLASMNISGLMAMTNRIGDAILTATRGLTKVSDTTSIEKVPTVKKGNENMHSIGLGVMNLHGYFAENKIAYESPQAREFARAFFSMFNFHSIHASMTIARERKQTFTRFEDSDYASGEYFGMYLEKSFLPEDPKIKALFEGVKLPSHEDWMDLKKKVMKYGLYHAYRLCIAPTGSISYLNGSTPSTMAIVEQIEVRTYANSTTYYPAPGLAVDNMFYYKSAYQMDQFKVIDLIGDITPHIDQGISTILHVNSDVSTRQLARYYLYAAKKGLKCLYYTRTNRLTMEECISCAL